MKYFHTSLILCLILLMDFQPVVGANTALRELSNRRHREGLLMNEMKDHSSRIHGNISNRKRSLTPNKRPSRETIPQLAKNIESFLQKVIPNHSLVQDLMGYITMPNPNANKKQRPFEDSLSMTEKYH